MSVFTQSIKTVLDSYADVIEGGNSWASGTAYRGIPGTRSLDEWVTGVGAITAKLEGGEVYVAAERVPFIEGEPAVGLLRPLVEVEPAERVFIGWDLAGFVVLGSEVLALDGAAVVPRLRPEREHDGCQHLLSHG